MQPQRDNREQRRPRSDKANLTPSEGRLPECYGFNLRVTLSILRQAKKSRELNRRPQGAPKENPHLMGTIPTRPSSRKGAQQFGTFRASSFTRLRARSRLATWRVPPERGDARGAGKCLGVRWCGMWRDSWALTGTASIWTMAAAPPPSQAWQRAAVTLAAAGATLLAPGWRRWLAPGSGGSAAN